MTGPQPPYGDQGGQTPGGGGDWQAPSDQTQFSPPDAGGPVGYDQPQSYDQPQQYDQYGQQQPGYPDQYSAPPGPYQEPYSAPPAPYGDPNAMMAPPPQSTNYVPWIVGGVAGVMVLVIMVIGGVLLLRGGESSGGGGPSGTTTTGGTEASKYSADKVSNACDVVDPTVLEKWAANEDKPPEHRENKNDYYSSFTCSARYKADGDDYSTASLSLYASVMGDDSTTDPKESFERSKKSAKGQTGTGRESGDISGLGEGAYYASYETDSEYSSSVMYELGVVDGNLTFTIHISAFVGEGEEVTKDDVASVAKEQAEKVMEGFKA